MVKLDIAGMFFQVSVPVDEDATVEDVMKAAERQTAGGMGPEGETFRYTGEVVTSPTGRLQTVNTITVVHRNGSARSRQTYSNTGNGRRYKDGIYSYSDNARFDAEGNFKPLDPNAEFVLAWQYYVYDADGKESARSGQPRRVVSYADNSADRGYTLAEGSTVVWRLVAIFTGPTHASLDQIEEPVNIAPVYAA